MSIFGTVDRSRTCQQSCKLCQYVIFLEFVEVILYKFCRPNIS